MAIYSFSTKDSKQADTDLMEYIKKHCEDTGTSFSHLVISQLRRWHDEQTRRSSKVQDPQ